MNKPAAAPILDSQALGLKFRVATTVLSQLISQVFAGILGVVILKIITNTLGIGGYGSYVTIMAFVTTFSLFTELGINTLTTREIAKRPDSANEILSHNLGLRLALATVAIPLIFGISFVFYPHATHQLRTGILIMSCYLVFDVIWASMSSFYAAKVKGYVSAAVSSLQQVIFFVLVLFIAKMHYGLLGFLVAYVFSIAVVSLFLLWTVKRKLRSLRPRANLQAWREGLRMSFAVGLIAIIYTIYLRVDSIMLSIISGAAAVGVYGVAYSLVGVFSALPGYIMGAIGPSLATAKGVEYDQIVQKAFHYMITFASISIVGSVVLRNDIVRLVSSSAFAHAATPFAILMLASIFSYPASVFSFASIAVNKHHRFVRIACTSLVLNIAINLVFIPKFGFVGAAWATLITEIIATLYGYSVFHKATGVSVHIRAVAKPILAGTAFLTIGLIVYPHLAVNSHFINCVGGGILLGLPYFVLLYLIKGLPSELSDVFTVALSKFKSTYKHH